MHPSRWLVTHESLLLAHRYTGAGLLPTNAWASLLAFMMVACMYRHSLAMICEEVGLEGACHVSDVTASCSLADSQCRPCRPSAGHCRHCKGGG